MLLYVSDCIAQPCGIGVSGQEGNNALRDLSMAQVVMQLDHPGTQALKHGPIGLLPLPLGAKQRTTQGFVLVIHFLVLLVGQDRVDQLQHACIAFWQYLADKPLQSST
ncbi:hypothetical protein D3C77_675230 [compost metagenome]